MSRSFRKTPSIGIAGDTDKPFKVQENKRQRRKMRQRVKLDEEDPHVHQKEYGDPWDSMKDGKQYLKRRPINPKYMRK